MHCVNRWVSKTKRKPVPFPRQILLCSLFAATALCAACGSKKVPRKPVVIPAAKTNETVVTAAVAPIGRVASINKSSRFVVISYSIGSEPTLRQKLNVYRNNLKVGELRVTGPQSEGNTVADIIVGEVELNDEVRED
jgi:hypothetical protein